MRTGDGAGGAQQSTGVPSGGEHETGTYSPTGGPGLHHWQRSTITEPGLDDRGGVFFAAIEMTRMPMILTDPNKPDNPIAFADRAFLDLTGYAEEEIIGRNCRFLQGARTSPEHVAELRNAVAEKRAVSVEILNYKRDGTPFWNAVYVAPVFGPDDRLLYFFASQLDITRRRSSEQAFRQAQKMESIGQLTAGLAHDFNNLLQVVSGNLEMLAAKLADEKLCRFVDNAAGAAERGARLTKQLLAFAQDDARPKADQPQRPHRRIRRHAGKHSRRRGGPALQPQAARPALHGGPGPPRDGAAQRGHQRARRDAQGRHGDGRHLLGAAGRRRSGAQPAAPGRVRRPVRSDDGEGMPPHVLERATEPFFTTKEQGKGTGLGLAMVQGFVQQSLGRLEIESELGRGTTIRMLLPAAAQGAASGHKGAAEPAPPRDEPRGAETILGVEDSDDVLALTRDRLDSLGYRVLVARNGEEGLDVFERERDGVDLVFTDIVMPGGLNGVVLADRVRERRPEVPVLLTTGYNEELVADGPGAAALQVLGKPYTRTQLADRIRAALNAAKRRGRPPDGRPRVRGPSHEG